jgi:predicted peroxiredoxin
MSTPNINNIHSVLIMLRAPDQYDNGREAIRLAKHMQKIRQKQTTLVMWGPQGASFSKIGKKENYDLLIDELLSLDVKIFVCRLGLQTANVCESDIQKGIICLDPEKIPELLLTHANQLIVYF